MSENKIVIVSGGMAEDDFIRESLHRTNYDTLICCDSGMGVLRRIGINPDVILGDFDSVKADDKAFFRKLPDIVWEMHPSVKNGTDTELATEYAIESLKATGIDIYAATGTRLDHVLGNLELLYMGYTKKCPVTIFDSHNKISILGPGEYYFRKSDYFGDFVSFVPYAGECKGVSLEGFKYEVRDFDFVHGLSRGISNVASADNTRITIKEGFLIKIESAD